MKRTSITNETKGWAIGPWNTSANYAVGWACQPRDQVHQHERVSETYIVVRGRGTLIVGEDRHSLDEGEVVYIEPGEYHGWLDTSPDFLMVMIHHPVDPLDKIPVPVNE